MQQRFTQANKEEIGCSSLTVKKERKGRKENVPIPQRSIPPSSSCSQIGFTTCCWCANIRGKVFTLNLLLAIVTSYIWPLRVGQHVVGYFISPRVVVEFRLPCRMSALTYFFAVSLLPFSSMNISSILAKLSAPSIAPHRESLPRDWIHFKRHG